MDPSAATHTAADVIRLLALEPLPHEGGWFRRTAEATECRPDGRRDWSMIHALFTPDNFSALHRLAVEEIWCFQGGDPLEVLQLIEDSGRAEHVTLGAAIATGQRLHVAIPRGIWQGARVIPGGRWSLVSCISIPEFRWQDFELGERNMLARKFAAVAHDIALLARAEGTL